MKTIQFDPRDFISPPYVKCPKCGKDSFGVLMITGDAYLRRCRECFRPHPKRGDSMIRCMLPKLKKKVVYVDQFALSEMMKALNPKTKAHRKGTIDQFWMTLYERLDSLCKLQLIICPMSECHREESLFSRFFQALKRLYTLLSYGVAFCGSGTIQRFQVSQHAKNWIAGAGEQQIELNVHSVTHGSINAWQEKLIVSPNVQYSQDIMDDWQRSREATYEGIRGVFERWQNETHRSFDDWYREEAQGFGQGVLRNYFSYLERFEGMFADRAEVVSTQILPSESVFLIHEIRHAFEEAGISQADVLPKVAEYFASPSIRNVPCVKIGAMLWAALARKAASGRTRPPTYGMKVDIEMLSVFSPYCDAMFIDRECHGYLKEVPLREEIDYGTRIFSMSNKDEFLDYLNGIEAGASEEHLAAVDEVYGKEGREPYTALYQAENAVD